MVHKKEGRLKTFDVALYKTLDGLFVLHRIIEVKEDGYIFTGDFLTKQEFVNEEAVLGFVTGYFTDKKRKKFVDAYSPKRLKKVAKYYKNQSKRARYIKRKGRLIFITNKVKGLFLRKGDKDV